MDPARLLAEGEWLRRLAIRLSRDGDEADDLVQETYVAALDGSPDASRPLRPWLAEVLRNRWRMRRRGGARRAAREAIVEGAREAPTTADALLERAAILRDLVALVVALPESLRTALLLRYSEGLTSGEIARATGVAEGTVRWRIKEALDRLRAGLDAEERGPGWRLAFAVPLAGPPLVPLFGGVIMKKVVVAALAVVLLGGLTAVFLRRRATDAPGEAKPAAAPAAAAVTPVGGRLSGERPAVGLSAAAIVALDDPAAPGGAFVGRVVNWSTGEGVADAELSFSSDGAITSVVADREGRFTFQPPAAGTHQLVTATATGFLPYAPELGTSKVVLHGRPSRRVAGVTVFLFPAIDYTGEVVGPDGAPVAGAEVRLVGTPQGEQALERLEDRFVSDASGKFVFHAPDDTVFEARHPKFGPGRGILAGDVQLTRRMRIRLGKPGEGRELGSARLAGRVEDERGAAVEGAMVQVAPVVRPGDDPSLPPLLVMSGEGGRFAVEAIDPGEYRVAVRHDDFAPTEVRARAGARDVRVRLAAGSALDGRVVDTAGVPVPAFTVLVMVADGLRRDVLTTRSVIDADGRFSVPHLPPGTYLFVAAARDFARGPEVAAEVVAGERATVELVLPRGGAITGVVTSKGEPLPYARIGIEGVGGGASVAPLSPGTVTDERGEFRLTGVPPGTATIQIAAGNHHIKLIGGLSIADGATVGPLAIALRPTEKGETPQIELVGIGVKLTPGDDAMIVDGVAPGSGALAAGLATGDQIVSVDGTLVKDDGFQAAIGRIRGAEGTRVRLGIRRAGAMLEIDVERRPLKY